ncbi:hypothetical protein BV898_14885 [Hypsibius exemplaris]|uniref:Uncharacterized protein n=1 Tax=Hypsibius exemplaris TaxID=2072580 RepID=A0A9X6NGT2_HYPEX|nr:hypothetical protein BV898_14885 [Hypsibius exemplaris]
MHPWTSEKRSFSGGAQELYLDRIFSVIGTTNKYFVEFGFDAPSYEAAQQANTGKLYHDGWRGLLLDGGHENKEINLQKKILFADNIAKIFYVNDVPIEVDYVSCDMDSHDLWVLRAILEAGYRPRVMSSEYNVNYPLSAALTIFDPTVSRTGSAGNNDTFSIKWLDCAFGSSAKALWMLAKSFGYELVGRVSYLDLIFVRADLIEDWMLLPELEWFFRNEQLGRLFHMSLTDNDTLSRVIDFETYSKTLDFDLSHAAAMEILRRLDLECFRPLRKDLQ